MRWCRCPWLLFWAHAAGLCLVFWALGQFQPRLYADSRFYLDYDLSSWAGALGDLRTPGYPLLLAGVKIVSPDLGLLPFFQFFLHLAAVAGFARALQGFGLAAGRAVAAALPLLYLHTFWRLSFAVVSDLPALSLAIIGVALLLYLAGGGRAWGWALLAGVLTFTVLVRPAYLFLVVFVPLVGGVLRWLQKGRAGRPARFSGALLLASWGPLLLYGGLRWAAVGQFGVTEFGAVAMSGVTTQIMDERTVAALPTDLRPLAERIRRLSREQGLMPVLPPGQQGLDYERLAAQYDPLVWRICPQAAREVVGPEYGIDGRKKLEYGVLMRRLSLAVIVRRPAGYLQWIWLALAHGLGVQLTYSLLPALGGGLGLLTIWSWSRSGRPAALIAERWGAARPEYAALALIALIFLFGHLGLTVLVNYPQPRYALAGGAFLGCWPALFIYDLIQAWRGEGS